MDVIKPLLKWVGGKGQLLKDIEAFLPEEIGTYFEPFFGGGALLFYLKPDRAIVNDLNGELMNLYRVVRDNPGEFIEHLRLHRNEADYFYRVRSMDRDRRVYENMTDVERASRIMFLNKTCYNGLYRVNSRGELNAPFGRYRNPKICDETNIMAVSRFFNSIDIEFLNGDFENILEFVERGDFVYLDPPYYPVSDSASFTGYVAGGFGEAEQRRLKNFCDRLNEHGVNFLLSNSATSFIEELYEGYDINYVYARRSINSNGQGRGEVEEVLIKNYD